MSLGQRLLVLDDDAGVVDFLSEALRSEGYQVEGMTDPRAALERIGAEPFDLVISDLEMPGLRGSDLLAAVLERKPSQLVLLITAFGSIEKAVAAVRAGACDFVAKPFKIESLVFAIERAFRDRELKREVVRLKRALPAGEEKGLVARSAGMQKVLELARRAARADSTVLLTGETGTGKSAVARFIHEASDRRAQPFLQLNCAALPATLIESELFGVRRGAFTDARESRPGAFAEAGGGTLFLDEVGELPGEVQAKLLHALETGKVRPLGAGGETTVRARVVAATNQPLEERLKEGSFRADLYYRLNVIRIELPPLRTRKEDLVPLVDRLLAAASDKHQRQVLGISAAALKKLSAHAWPGNVRELANLVERAVAMSDHDTLLPEDFELPSADDAARDFLPSGQALDDVERAYVKKVVDEHKGNKSAAARVLGINRRTLYRKLGE